LVAVVIAERLALAFVLLLPFITAGVGFGVVCHLQEGSWR
jgi:hypothetical protein